MKTETSTTQNYNGYGVRRTIARLRAIPTARYNEAEINAALRQHIADSNRAAQYLAKHKLNYATIYHDDEAEIDYARQHEAEMYEAPMPDSGAVATPTGHPLPKELILAAMEGNADKLRAKLAEYPWGTVNDRLAGRPHAPTLLHFAACAYASICRRYGRLAAQRYDEATKTLLRRGADPQLGALRAGGCSVPEVPASFCDGYQPPSLAARMLRDADEDRCGWQPENGQLRKVRANTQSTRERLRRADSRAARAAA